MSVFRAAKAWHRRLGPLDANAAAVVGGQLTMPKTHLTFCASRKPNHARSERNEAAKIALGPKFATWTWLRPWQGRMIVEMTPHGHRNPLFIQSLGAVDKATAPWRAWMDPSK